MKGNAFYSLIAKFITPAVAAATPLAFVISCGASDEANDGKAATTPLLADVSALSNLQVNPSSTHDALVWPELPKSASISSYAFYLSEVARNDVELAALPLTSWQSNLPTQVNYDHAKRFLYAKVIPANGYQLASPFVDLSASAKLSAVKSRVDTTGEFVTLNLANIKFQVIVDQPPVLEEVSVPNGVKIRYDYDETHLGLGRDEREVEV